MVNKFTEGQQIQHQNGNVYRVLLAPRMNSFLEYNKETFYIYQSVKDSLIWVRCKSEMEDGRFESCE